MEQIRRITMCFWNCGLLLLVVFLAAESPASATTLALSKQDPSTEKFQRMAMPVEPFQRMAMPVEPIKRMAMPVEPTSFGSDHKDHRLTVATSIFKNLLLQTHNRDRAKMLHTLGPKEISYHDGETIATVHTDVYGNVTRCSLFEIKELEDIDRTLAQYAEQNKPVQKITFRTMLDVITACQAIDPALVKVQPVYHNTQSSSEDQALNLTPMRSLISGIIPGTKWCGLGDIATDYEDLGMEKELDKCCRAHDHCPTKLKSFRRGYGLINWSFYTKSHCECDSLLYECLKTAGTSTSEALGNFYFNVLKVQCIDEEQPVKCMTRQKLTNTCRVWAPDPTATEKRLFFRDVRRQF